MKTQETQQDYFSKAMLKWILTYGVDELATSVIASTLQEYEALIDRYKKKGQSVGFKEYTNRYTHLKSIAIHFNINTNENHSTRK